MLHHSFTLVYNFPVATYFCVPLYYYVTDTTDLQRAEVVFFENNIFLLCLLADNSPALGCSIRLRLRNTNDSQSDDVFELRRPTSEPGSDDVIVSNCNTSTNRYLAYREIVGVDLEGDGSLGEVWLRVNETEAESLDEFTRLTNCTLPQPRKCVYMYMYCVYMYMYCVYLVYTGTCIFMFACIVSSKSGREGGREREGGKKKRKKRERERGREGGREGGKEI